MELLQDEKIIMQDDAKSDFFGKGILYMTNKRILLEIKTGGLLSKTTEVRLDKALGTIKTPFQLPGEEQLQMQFEGSVEPTNIHVANAEKWEAAIKSALVVSGKM